MSWERYSPGLGRKRISVSHFLCSFAHNADTKWIWICTDSYTARFCCGFCFLGFSLSCWISQKQKSFSLNQGRCGEKSRFGICSSSFCLEYHTKYPLNSDASDLSPSMRGEFFRLSATVSRIGLMASRVHHCHGGPPPPSWLTPPP